LSQIISTTFINISIRDPTVIWQNYLNDKHYFVKKIDNAATFIAPLSVDAVDGTLKMSDTKYKFLDKSVLYTIEVSRKAVQQAGWSSNDVLESTWVPLVVQQIYLKTLSEYLKLAKHKLWLLQPRLWKYFFMGCP
jgi:hypothetical protein